MAGQRVIGKLNAVMVAQARSRGLYGDGGGLFLQVGSNGSKSWVFRWKENGKHHSMGLGAEHAVDLKKAREKARACREARDGGRDPIADRQAVRMAQRVEQAKTVSFRECAEKYISVQKKGWSQHTFKQWSQQFARYVFPVFGVLPAQDIDRGLVMTVLQPIWSDKTATAVLLRARIEAVLDWAAASGHRTGDNPARWRGSLKKLLAPPSKVRPVKHHPAMSYSEIAGFIGELRKAEDIVRLDLSARARILEFLILTAARTSEVLGMRWGEVDLKRRLWTVPAERMKAGEEHRVPLSDPALAILAGTPKNGDLVFPDRNGRLRGASTALLRVLEYMGRGDLTVHGFRSTFRDWGAEQTSYSSEMLEMALAHKVGSKVEQAYRRTDMFEKRQRLMADWARFCEARPVDDEVVVSIRAHQ